MLLLTDQTTRILGGCLQKTDSTVSNGEALIQDSQTILPTINLSTQNCAPTPSSSTISNILSSSISHQESKYESRPKQTVVDLIRSPNRDLPPAISKFPTTSVVSHQHDESSSFAYDLHEFEEFSHMHDEKIADCNPKSGIYIQDVLRRTPSMTIADQITKTTPITSNQEIHQISDESQFTSQTSSISPFVISAETKDPHRVVQDLSSSPVRVSASPRVSRKFIREIIERPTSADSYYIEGATVGIEALKVEIDPVSQLGYFYVIVLFEELENTERFPLLVDPTLCREILKISPDEYALMLHKLSSKSERREFKVITCTKFTELMGKFTFLVNKSKNEAYIGTIISFYNP